MAAAASGHDASPVGQGLASEGASFRTGALPSFLGRCEPSTRAAVNHNDPHLLLVRDQRERTWPGDRRASGYLRRAVYLRPAFPCALLQCRLATSCALWGSSGWRCLSAHRLVPAMFLG